MLADWGLIERLLSVAGIGGFMAFMMWRFMKMYMSQMNEQMKSLAKGKSETEERLFKLAQTQTEYISRTATALAQIASSMSMDRFCPFARNADEGNDEQKSS